jgi:hypothetical protein
MFLARDLPQSQFCPESLVRPESLAEPLRAADFHRQFFPASEQFRSSSRARVDISSGLDFSFLLGTAGLVSRLSAEHQEEFCLDLPIVGRTLKLPITPSISQHHLLPGLFFGEEQCCLQIVTQDPPDPSLGASRSMLEGTVLKSSVFSRISPILAEAKWAISGRKDHYDEYRQSEKFWRQVCHRTLRLKLEGDSFCYTFGKSRFGGDCTGGFEEGVSKHIRVRFPKVTSYELNATWFLVSKDQRSGLAYLPKVVTASNRLLSDTSF